MEPAKDTRLEQGSYFDAYSHFARTLRLWFIAYGVGAPIAICSSDRLLDAVVAARSLNPVVPLFFAGIAVQIMMAMIWRTALWYQYRAEYKPNSMSTWRYRASCRISDQYWLEFLADLFTLVLFAYATWVAVSAICMHMSGTLPGSALS